MRQWPADGVAGCPYHKGTPAAIRSVKPNGNSIQYIKTDVAHTYAIAGFGKDELASSLIFLAVHCEVFGPGNYSDQLENAYADFSKWCDQTKHRTTIKEFSKKVLKIVSLLELIKINCIT